VHANEIATWKKLHSLAKRVLDGDGKAYGEALSELSPFNELSVLGSAITFHIHDSKLIECELRVNGRHAIPRETKALTSNGKVAIKVMPKGRYHELYQDYVCGSVLRVVREVLALLPIDVVLVTALVPVTQGSTGASEDLPVLSAAINRETLNRLDFENLDPSDSMVNFVHRGDVLASRKSGDFTTVIPLTPADLIKLYSRKFTWEEALICVREKRSYFMKLISKQGLNNTNPVIN
jgi:hypothetical protein